MFGFTSSNPRRAMRGSLAWLARDLAIAESDVRNIFVDIESMSWNLSQNVRELTRSVRGRVLVSVPMNNYARLLAFLIVAVSASWISAAADRPNILYFYVDDMGWGSIGPNGQAARAAKGLPRVLMPNLDKLAAEGVNFTRSYGMTVCSPARSSQQTGFHQGHTFADRNDPDNAKKAIRTDDVTIGDVLSDAGYVTGYWGKWGYGGAKDQVDRKSVV